MSKKRRKIDLIHVYQSVQQNVDKVLKQILIFKEYGFNLKILNFRTLFNILTHQQIAILFINRSFSLLTIIRKEKHSRIILFYALKERESIQSRPEMWIEFFLLFIFILKSMCDLKIISTH